jgi:hypothetical protein
MALSKEPSQGIFLVYRNVYLLILIKINDLLNTNPVNKKPEADYYQPPVTINQPQLMSNNNLSGF